MFKQKALGTYGSGGTAPHDLDFVTRALGWKSLANTELEYFTIITLTANCSVRKSTWGVTIKIN